MEMQIDVTVDYSLSAPGAAILVIEAAAVPGQELRGAWIDLGELQRFARVPGEEGIGERIVLGLGPHLSCRYSARVGVTRPRPDFAALEQVPVEQLPGDALRYLLSSRYCEGERFGPFVLREFSQFQGGAKVAAMRDWIEANLSYVPGASDANTTAVDTYLDRQGICRDYAHLLICFCRAAMIPARIASVYSPSVTPQDFHAVTEVYLSGAWHLIDATGMAGADEMAVIAVGRDATDVAFLTTVSQATLERQEVLVSRTA